MLKTPRCLDDIQWIGWMRKVSNVRLPPSKPWESCGRIGSQIEAGMSRNTSIDVN